MADDRYRIDVGISDYYKHYLKLAKHQQDLFSSKFINPQRFIIDSKTYKTILKDGLKLLSEKVLRGEIVELPHSMGKFLITKKKINFDTFTRTNNLEIDWPTFKKTGIKTYHMNEHSDYCRFKWVWSYNKKALVGKNLYRFIACRKNKRTLAAKIKSGFVNYFEEIK